MSETLETTLAAAINDTLNRMLDYCYCEGNLSHYLDGLEEDHIWLLHLELAELLDCECWWYWRHITIDKATGYDIDLALLPAFITSTSIVRRQRATIHSIFKGPTNV